MSRNHDSVAPIDNIKLTTLDLQIQKQHHKHIGLVSTELLTSKICPKNIVCLLSGFRLVYFDKNVATESTQNRCNSVTKIDLKTWTQLFNKII